MDYQRSKQLQISNQTRLAMYCINNSCSLVEIQLDFDRLNLPMLYQKLHFGLLTRNNCFIQVQRPGLIERKIER